MQLDELLEAINLCNEGQLEFNQNSWGFCFLGHWYPVVAVVNQATGEPHNLYRSMALIQRVLPFTAFREHVHYRNGLPAPLTLLEIKDQVDVMAEAMKRLFPGEHGL